MTKTLDLFDRKDEFRLFMEVSAFDEVGAAAASPSPLPEWVPYLPAPNEYHHPKYGKIVITPDRNRKFVQNFKDGAYQDRLPIDAEHETKLSGAMAWVKDLKLNEDGSVAAQVDWTPRGTKLMQEGAFRYISPEWYDTWVDNATGIKHNDILVGGALTTRPFFKEPHLKQIPLVANEDGLLVYEGDDQGDMSLSEGKDGTMDPEKFAELEFERDSLKLENQEFSEKVSTLTTQLAERENELRSASEQIVELRAEARRAKFREEVSGLHNDGVAWRGDADKNIARLEKLAQAFGEDSDDFNEFVTEQRAMAVQLKDSKVFAEIGSSAGTSGGAGTGTAWERIEAQAKTIQASEHVPFNQAIVTVMERNPALYAEYKTEKGGK